MQAVYEHVDRAAQWALGEIIFQVAFMLFFTPAFSRDIS